MIAGRQDACARNNALWCDTVLKAAGARTAFHGGFWIAREKVLPLYPNIVTLSAKPAADLYAALEMLPEGAAVKDSFDTLDLAPLGYRKRLSGTWLFRPPVSEKRPPISTGWHRISHSEALKRWLAGWNADESLHAILPSKLLEKKTVDFSAIVKDGAIKAGGIFNTGPKLEGKEVVGLSNVFCRRSWLYTALHGLLEPYAQKPVCTYEEDDGVLPVYRQLGFDPCGRLGVWVKG